MGADQQRVFMRYGVDPEPALPDERLGVSPNVLTGLLPLNALRHPREAETCGWFIWAGTELSSDPGFFVSLHVAHLTEWCPAIIPYLALPPGSRALLAPDYEDVWFDPSLLDI